MSIKLGSIFVPTLIMKKEILFLLAMAIMYSCTTPKNNVTIEQHRPLFHFTPPKMWMNDPNGMVYYKGEYHLFYQHFPDSAVWGPMHWGHAVSKDLMHWQHLPIALYPDSLGYIFSGSAVVDENNTSGFQKGDEKPLVAIFTYHNIANEKAKRVDVESQGIAYSNDKGRTWTKYANNPVAKNAGERDFRDPKVIWHTASKQWIMTLAVGNHVEFRASKNLKDWSKVGEFGKNAGAHGGVWECPDLFPLKIEGTAVEKWILIVNMNPGAPNFGSGTQYFVGTFDGTTFKNDNAPEETLWVDYGRDNYAGVTWFNAPNNRRLFLGWMSDWSYANKVPTTTWRSANTIPRELSLKNTANGARLFQVPVKELEILRGTTTELKGQTLTQSLDLNASSKCHELLLNFDLTKTNAKDFGVELSNAKGEKVLIGYETETKRFYIDRSNSGKKDFEKGFAGKHYAQREETNTILKMNLVIDVASVELFTDDGAMAMTDIFFPTEDFNKITLFSNGGNTQLIGGKTWEIKSASE